VRAYAELGEIRFSARSGLDEASVPEGDASGVA
jgi:hypothetical protein